MSLTHNAIDTESFGLEYVVYVLNGFAGVDAPVISEGGLSDNNWFKALGTRIRATINGSGTTKRRSNPAARPNRSRCCTPR